MTPGLVQREAASRSLSGAGRDAGCCSASAVGGGLCTGRWWGLSDADAHLCTGSTATCCTVYTSSVQVSALNTASSSSPFQHIRSEAVAFSAGRVTRAERAAA